MGPISFSLHVFDKSAALFGSFRLDLEPSRRWIFRGGPDEFFRGFVFFLFAVISAQNPASTWIRWLTDTSVRSQSKLLLSAFRRTRNLDFFGPTLFRPPGLGAYSFNVSSSATRTHVKLPTDVPLPFGFHLLFLCVA